MTDDVLKELWAIKDNIAKEHDYKIDQLAKFFLQKQSAQDKKNQYKQEKAGTATEHGVR